MKLKSFALTIVFFSMFLTNVYANTIYDKNIIKVGVYGDAPYYSINKNGEVSGYYHDFLSLLQKEGNFEYEYVLCDFSEGLKKLEEGSIDIILGVAITPDRKDKVLFNKYIAAIETHALVTKKDIGYGKLYELDGLRLGLVKDGANSQWILDNLMTLGINVIPVFDTNFEKLEELLEEDKVDVIINSVERKHSYNEIYRFSPNQTYIAANKNNAHILETIDKSIEKTAALQTNPISKLYDKYFNPPSKIEFIKDAIIIFMLIISSLIIIVFVILPKIKTNIVKNKIKIRMSNNYYFMHYQPIYNAKTNTIVGFESLLRFKDKNNRLIPPCNFIDEIVKNNMMYDISIWILESIIRDYNIIKNNKSIDENALYISINLSSKEIENESFINKAIKILSKSNIGPNRICIEIIEKVKVDNSNKLDKSISKLKNAGFKIAIDDFGVEYSNLDVINKLDFDTIKLDKYFIDGICKSDLQKEIVLFVSKIAKSTNKALILEGIEEEAQDILIKTIENENLYVQGYYYSKPLPIDQIELI